MTLSITHATVASGADSGSGEIHKAEWNAAHIITGSLSDYSLKATHTVGGSPEATVSFTGLTSADIMVQLVGVKANTGTNTLTFSLSTDNSTYSTAVNFGVTSALGTSLVYGAGFITGLTQGYGAFVGPVTTTNSPASTPKVNTTVSGATGSFYATSPITAIQLALSSNSFDTGSVFNIYGR